MSLAVGIIIRSTVALVLAGLIALILRRASATVRHAVWALGIIAALVVPFAARILPSVAIPISIIPASSPIPGVSHDLSPGTHSVIWTSSPAEQARASYALRLMIAVWTLGGLFVLARFVLAARAVRRLLREPSVDESEIVRRLVSEVAAELSICRRIQLAFTSRQVSPMACGVFRRAIILPSSISLWPEPRQRAVIAHELAHVKRNDGLMQCVSQILCGLYWFNPIVWFAAHRMRLEREYACDDHVLRLGAKPEEYAMDLVEIARTLGSRAAISATAVPMAERSQLESRLLSILAPHVNRRSLSGMAYTTLFGASLLVGLTLAMVHPFASAPLTWTSNVTASNLVLQGDPNAPATRPQLIGSIVQPSYTVDAFENLVEGTVTLQAAVDKQGNVTSLRVVNGIGHGLDESALADVAAWKFVPASRNGVPVESTMDLSVEFSLARASVRLGPGITPPVIVSRVEPQPTEEARIARARGTVVLEVLVQVDGTVEIVRVIQPLGYGLVQNAIQALRQWTFTPGSKDGVRLPISMNVSVVFDWR